jgi:propanol-preferring alcohol dehydrogenase
MSKTMTAMRLEKTGGPLVEVQVPIPEPGPDEFLVKIKACGVCRTDLHVVDGDLQDGILPIIPGHEAIGEVVKCGEKVSQHKKGDHVGIPWLGYTCGECKYCKRDQENLCDNGLFHGFTLNGGYAEYMLVKEGFAINMPEKYFNSQSTPLLCAGLIGYRSYRKTLPESVRNLGLYGFGASAHLLAQLAINEGKKVFAFTRPGDESSQKFARELGCAWAGASDQLPPEKLDAAIVFAPVGSLMVEALKATDKGGRVVSAGIHMSPIPEFEYKYLWEERSMHSVANLERNDGREFMEAISKADIQTHVHLYHLLEANHALEDLRQGKINGAAVLVI